MKPVTVLLPGRPVNRLEFELEETSPVQAAMADALASPEGYEPATWSAIGEILRPGDRAIDVGGHVGILACFMAACVGPGGSVDVFEPHPGNRARLVLHARRNGLDWMTVHHEAVGREVGETRLYRNADNDGGHALWNPALHPVNSQTRIFEPPPVESRMTTLDRALGTMDRLRLIKIDTEGAETEVLLGALRLMARTRPHVIAEINRFGLHQMGSSEAVLRSVLRAQRYAEAVLWDAPPFRRIIGPTESVQANYVFNMLFSPTEEPTA